MEKLPVRLPGLGCTGSHCVLGEVTLFAGTLRCCPFTPICSPCTEVTLVTWTLEALGDGGQLTRQGPSQERQAVSPALGTSPNLSLRGQGPAPHAMGKAPAWPAHQPPTWDQDFSTENNSHLQSVWT